MNITNLTIAEQRAALLAKKISPVELTQAYFDNIDKTDDKIGANAEGIGAYLTLCRDKAVEAAKSADLAAPLGGIPCGIKDNISTAGILTTCASRMLEDYVPTFDAAVVERLRTAGAVTLGKLNMDEFAMGGTTENSYFKPTRNPLDTSRVPGGSSGGSAAAVAAKQAAFTLGSDTGGSIRQPAAFCGVVGMKPTYGAVSRYGLIAFASSLDQIGPLTRNVEDNALVLDSIMGHDGRDSTSVKRDYTSALSEINGGVAGLRIGVPAEFYGDGIAPDVRAAVEDALRTYEKLGAKIVKLSMPGVPHALSAYYVISSAEASSNLARFDGVRYGHRAAEYENIDALYRNSRGEGFGDEVKRRIMLGTFALSSGYYDAYYKKALQVRSLIAAEFETGFESCDVMVTPVAPTVAYKLGAKKDDPIEMYMGDICTVPINIAGVPALSLPCGTGEGGMPVGLQIIAPHFMEARIYRAARALERAEKG